MADAPQIPDEAETRARNAPQRSAPLTLMLRRDAGWLRAAAAVGQREPTALGPLATSVRDQLIASGASFLSDLVAGMAASPPAITPSELEDALWELVGGTPLSPNVSIELGGGGRASVAPAITTSAWSLFR